MHTTCITCSSSINRAHLFLDLHHVLCFALQSLPVRIVLFFAHLGVFDHRTLSGFDFLDLPLTHMVLILQTLTFPTSVSHVCIDGAEISCSCCSKMFNFRCIPAKKASLKSPSIDSKKLSHCFFSASSLCFLFSDHFAFQLLGGLRWDTVFWFAWSVLFSLQHYSQSP